MEKGKAPQRPQGSESRAPGSQSASAQASASAPPQKSTQRPLPSVSSLGSEMQSMLLSSGKAAGGAAPGAASREYMSDVASSSGPAASHSFRTTQRTGGDDEFAAFNAPAPPAAADRQKFEHAWDAAEKAPAYDGLTAHDGMSAAAMTQPVRAAPNAQQLDADAQNFMAALDAEEAVPAPEHEIAPIVPLIPPHTALTEQWVPPDPRGPSTISEEQHAMHVALAERQMAEDNPFCAGERTLPTADDPVLKEGVFAPTPQEALASVWDAQGTREQKVREFRGAEDTHDTQVIIDRLKGWTVRDGYVTEVYGLPETLARTFGEAQQPRSDDPSTEERRERAIRRLNALYNHLNGPAGSKELENNRAQGIGADTVMEEWLKQHK